MKDNKQKRPRGRPRGRSHTRVSISVPNEDYDYVASLGETPSRAFCEAIAKAKAYDQMQQK